MTNDDRAKIIGAILILLILGCVILALWGILNAGNKCAEKGGTYVNTSTGWKCLQEAP